MNQRSQTMVSLDDFSIICRICLQSHNDMVDIFGSGMDNQLMEITKLKVKSDDKLPKTLCQTCRAQMDNFSEFQKKAKSSDILLRALLTNEENEMREKKSLVSKSGSRKRSSKRSLSKNIKHRKKSRVATDIAESNKMYLIVVPQTDQSDLSEVSNKICIKDLSLDDDNEELTNYCQNLVNDYCFDNTSLRNSKEILKFGSTLEHEVCSSEVALNNSDVIQLNKIYIVNLFIYNCSECEQSFDEHDKLMSHFLFEHNMIEPSVQEFFYECPVCKCSNKHKNNFIIHLEKHKEEGCYFIRSNCDGGISNKVWKKYIFTDSCLIKDLNVCCKVIKINLDTFVCLICLEKIESEADIFEHMKKSHCESFEVSSANFFVEYNCPICDVCFMGKKEKFIEHLFLHKTSSFYFLKVNSVGEPVKVEENENIFVTFEEAREASKIIDKTKRIWTVTDVNSCAKCDYSGHSLQLLCEHYSQEHSMIEVDTETLLSCPVCGTEFQGDKNCDVKYKLYDHLRDHKDENQLFIEINKNGFMKSTVEGYTDVFNQSSFFYGLASKSLTVDWNYVWHPKCGISDPLNSPVKEKLENKLFMYELEREVTNDNLHYICEKCGKTFVGKWNYSKHFSTHSKISDSGGKRPICLKCNKTFANLTSLYSHIKNHIQEGEGNDALELSLPKIICDVCGKIFSNHTSLTKHKRVHKAGKENSGFKCEICNKEFFRQTSYNRHISAHLNPKYFDCDVCKLPLPSVSSLQKHAEIHKSTSNTFDCKACKTSFLTKDSLTAHQTHTGHYLDRKPLECNVCHEKFFIGRKFTEHIKTHPKYKMGECTLCGKRLSTFQSLMLHMGRHFESNSILCPHCGKQFFEERNFHRHLLTHEGIKPFGCDVEGCEKSFYTLFELNRHKKYHSNTRDFVCAYCGKSFHEANHLTVHVRTHTGERPYICPHCKKGFITRTRCKHHIKLVHQGIGYDLIQSNISKKVTVFEAVETVN